MGSGIDLYSSLALCTAALFKTREWHSSSQSRCPPSVSITAAHSKRATCGELPCKHSRLHCVGRSASRGHRRLHCVGQSASCAVSFRGDLALRRWIAEDVVCVSAAPHWWSLGVFFFFVCISDEGLVCSAWNGRK